MQIVDVIVKQYNINYFFNTDPFASEEACISRETS